MIFHTTVVEDITAYLATPFYLLLARFYLSFLCQSLLHSAVIELTLQQEHSLGTVLRLVTSLSVFDKDFFFLASIWILILITKTHSRLHLINILTTCTTRAEGIPRHSCWVYIHLDGFIYQRRHEYRSKACHSLTLSIERRNAHQTMHTILALQESVGIFATFNLHGNALDTCFVTLLKVRDSNLISMSLSPAHIHTHKHLRPVLTLGATSSRVDFQHTVHRVFFLTEHVHQFQVFDGFYRFFIIVVNLLLCHELLLVEVESQL